MNFNGSGGLMFLIIAGLWLWIFTPSWFSRSQGRQEVRSSRQEVRSSRPVVRAEKPATRVASPRAEISDLAGRSIRLSVTRKVSSSIAVFALIGIITSIFFAVSQIFYWIVTVGFSTIFIASWSVARAAKRKNSELISKAATRRSNIYASVSNTLRHEDANGLSAGTPVNTRAWEPNRLPEPRQRIGELELPALAEVVGIEERVNKKAHATLESSALDEILRRRRANG